MLQFSLTKKVLIWVVVLLGFLFAMPNGFYNRVESVNDARIQLENGNRTPSVITAAKNWPSFLPSSLVNLGLDLRGGAHLLARVRVDQVYEVEKNTKDILTKIVDQDIIIESKRGCSEFALSYPNYKKIYKDKSKLMNYPNEWIANEKEFDEENTKDNIESKRIIQDTLSGGSLNNFLIINNWLND